MFLYVQSLFWTNVPKKMLLLYVQVTLFCCILCVTKHCNQTFSRVSVVNAFPHRVPLSKSIKMLSIAIVFANVSRL